MNIQIFDRHISLSDAQCDYIKKRVLHLVSLGEEVADESTYVRVDVESNKIKTSNKNITVQVTMFVPHSVIRAEVFSTTVEEGIDVAVEKLKKQLERYKGKKHRRDKTGQWIPTSTLEETVEAHQAEEVEPKIVKRKMVDKMPIMHEEEAIEQMELLDHSFFAFLNIATKKFSIVYKREEGGYGLIEFVPET